MSPERLEPKDGAPDPSEDLTEEELAAEQIAELPEREALSFVNAPLAVPVGAAVAAGLLNGHETPPS